MRVPGLDITTGFLEPPEAAPAGIEKVMDEPCRVVDALEPYDELRPETLALYEELSRRRRRTG